MSAVGVILVPPWAGLDRPALGPHVLQAVAKAAGFEVKIAYANLAFAARIGEALYHRVSYAPTGALLGERLFATRVFGGAPRIGLGEPALYRRVSRSDCKRPIQRAEARRIERATAAFGREYVAQLLADYDPWVVGASTTFEQTCPSLALLAEVRRQAPHVWTVLGGANCDGPMGAALAPLAPWVDAVVGGEAEVAFVEVLRDWAGRARPSEGAAAPDADRRVRRGTPCLDLDALPTPHFDDYFAQLGRWLPDASFARAGSTWLAYESSRGCWWGQKQHCTFCGLNGTGMQFRRKSPERVMADLTALIGETGVRNVCMADNIMPWPYFRELLPRLAETLPNTHIFYEQKANLSLEHCERLAAAGIRLIQPGIEALSSELLRLMRKGVSAAQNVRLLRYARATGVTLNWNLLYAFPGDRAAWYEQTVRLLPLLWHLCPPGGLYALSIDRFSPYFEDAARFGLSDVTPLAAYGKAFPAQADLASLAYHFTATYDSESRVRPPVIRRCERLIDSWLAAWRHPTRPPPTLALTQLDDDLYMLLDTRPCRVSSTVSFLSHAQATVVVGGTRHASAALVRWALRSRYAARVDDAVVPLAFAEPALFRALEDEAGRSPSTAPPAPTPAGAGAASAAS